MNFKSYCWHGGKILPAAKVGVPVGDLAVLRGYGVFDLFKTVKKGKPFLWPEHWARFQNSAKLLGLEIPVSEKIASGAVKQLLKQCPKQDANLRLLLTGGGKFYILLEPPHPFPPEVYETGIKLISHHYERTLPEAKSTNYLTMLRLQKTMEESGAREILHFANGKILECSTSNFFLVKNGRLITARDGVLSGTIRHLVIKLARKNKIPVEEREVAQAELAQADEAFLTATNKNIVPVVQVDDLKIGRGEVGPVTKKLMKIYEQFVAGY